MTPIVKNPSGFFSPAFNQYSLFSDDGGAYEYNFLGFTTILLDDAASDELRFGLKDLMEKNKIVDLHATSLIVKGKGQIRDRTEYARIYEAILQLIMKEFRRANYAYIHSFLASREANIKALGVHRKILAETMKTLGNPAFEKKYYKLYHHVCFPVYECFKQMPELLPTYPISIYLDSKDSFSKQMAETSYISADSGSLFDEVSEIMRRLIETYTHSIIEKELIIKRVCISDRKLNNLICVADSLSHLAYNYIKVIIKGVDKSSYRERMKHDLYLHSFLRQSGMPEQLIQQIRGQIREGFVFTNNEYQAIIKGTYPLLDLRQERN